MKIFAESNNPQMQRSTWNPNSLLTVASSFFQMQCHPQYSHPIQCKSLEKIFYMLAVRIIC